MAWALCPGQAHAALPEPVPALCDPKSDVIMGRDEQTEAEPVGALCQQYS